MGSAKSTMWGVQGSGHPGHSGYTQRSTLYWSSVISPARRTPVSEPPRSCRTSVASSATSRLGSAAPLSFRAVLYAVRTLWRAGTLVGRSRTGIGLFCGTHGHSQDSGATPGGLGARCADNEGRTGRTERRGHRIAPPRSPQSSSGGGQGSGQGGDTENTGGHQESFPRSRDVTPPPSRHERPPERARARRPSHDGTPSEAVGGGGSKSFDRALSIASRPDRRGDDSHTPGPAGEYGLSAYDSADLERAQRRGLGLATLDRRLAQAARVAGVNLIPVWRQP